MLLKKKDKTHNPHFFTPDQLKNTYITLVIISWNILPPFCPLCRNNGSHTKPPVPQTWQKLSVAHTATTLGPPPLYLLRQTWLDWRQLATPAAEQSSLAGLTSIQCS